jgi:hypothetical protein
MKTLIVILSETRAHELTFGNIKENLINQLDADLCICIGIKNNYDYENGFFKLAKYKFLYDEPYDYSSAFDYANNIILEENNINKKDFYLNNLHWRKFLEIKDQFLGGIKDDINEHPGSAGILIFFRWFLLYNLIKNNLINEYDRFIITRSDYLYLSPHPNLDILDNNYIWIPNGEHYGGVTDRHVVISNKYIVKYLNILNSLVLKSNNYYDKLKNYNNWNLERIIKFHLEQEEIFNKVRFFPYIMFAIRPLNGTTRWSTGEFNEKLNCYIKYYTEYNNALHYKNKLNLIINNYYIKEINDIENLLNINNDNNNYFFFIIILFWRRIFFNLKNYFYNYMQK